jgi:predicted acetyltransferase
MEIRPIRPEEEILMKKIQSIAFLYKQDFSKAQSEPDKSPDDYKQGRAAFDDRGKMCSCFLLTPFQVCFNGIHVPMGGVGGVASLPEEREKRYMRRIFDYTMQEMYENSYVFSYLYPFSHKYYRKFGYELNMTRIGYSIPISAFRQFNQTGTLKLYTNDMDPKDIISLYEQYIVDKNLAVVRNEALWKRFLEKDPYKDNVYLYIWYNEQGLARGYIKFHVEKPETNKNNMHVQELIWLDRQAFTGIFSFIGGLTAQIEKMLWDSPSFVNLLPFFHEPYEIKQEISTYGMNRVVNVEKALNLMSTPEGSGEIIIGIEDEFFPVNSGNYRISWENSSHRAQRTDKAVDLSCDVQALSQLITGFATVEDLKNAGRVEINSKENLLDAVFPKKKLFINNYF